MKKLLFDCGTRDPVASFGLFFLRMSVGLMMLIGHGLPKLHHFATMKNEFPVANLWPFSMMNNPLSMVAAIGAEVGAASLVALGFLTRPAAFVLGFAMVVAAFQVGAQAPWFMGPGVAMAKEPALLYLFPLCAIILAGPGAWSIDAGLCQDKRRRF